jgi:hypothetical protein
MKQSPRTHNANLKQYATRLKAEYPFVYFANSPLRQDNTTASVKDLKARYRRITGPVE